MPVWSPEDQLWYVMQVDVELAIESAAAKFFPGYQGETSPLTFGVFLGPEGPATLDSALNLPRQEWYPSLFPKAGALLRSLVKNHAFIDGNKRIALTVTMMFLMFNGYFALVGQKELVNLALQIADPGMRWEDVAAWLERNSFSLLDTPESLQARLVGRPDLGQVVDELKSALAEIAAELKASRGEDRPSDNVAGGATNLS